MRNTRLGLLATALVALTALRAAPPTRARTTLTFQHGGNGRAGPFDLEIGAVAPTACLEGNPNASADADNDGGESQILLRFEDIIGPKAGQVPPRSTVHAAKVVVSAFDEGNPVHLHRMLVPW